MGVASGLWAAGVLGALWNGGAQGALPWAVASGLAITWLLVRLWFLLRTPSPAGGDGLRSRFGLPTWVTLGRGYAAALLAGWVIHPAPSLPGSWLAVALFLIAALGDILDGWLARKLGQVTELGRRLDGIVDALAMVVGVLVAVRWGRLPAGFLLLGMAPYLFALFLRHHRRRGTLLHPLPYRRSRRLVGAAFFAWVAFALSPVPAPEGASVGHGLVAVLVAGSFLLDGRVILRGASPWGPKGCAR